jgi:hypothetical protein
VATSEQLQACGSKEIIEWPGRKLQSGTLFPLEDSISMDKQSKKLTFSRNRCKGAWRQGGIPNLEANLKLTSL